ncbi:hypothetical protein M3C21_05270 [Micrococcus luteus]|uniref:hypothetical protein n=1 Tax=Micrococcus luteus TaxID=1270 RepID=UPI0037ECD477|nr:hypothetical protein [Micrococcus luteus]
MAEHRRHHQILLQVVDRKPMPQPYPWVSYRSRDELRAAVVRATRVYWSAARRVDVTLAGPDWRECRGEVFLSFPGGQTVDARFFPVFDPSRPASEQARRSEGDR